MKKRVDWRQRTTFMRQVTRDWTRAAVKYTFVFGFMRQVAVAIQYRTIAIQVFLARDRWLIGNAQSCREFCILYKLLFYNKRLLAEVFFLPIISAKTSPEFRKVSKYRHSSSSEDCSGISNGCLRYLEVWRCLLWLQCQKDYTAKLKLLDTSITHLCFFEKFIIRIISGVYT